MLLCARAEIRLVGTRAFRQSRRTVVHPFPGCPVSRSARPANKLSFTRSTAACLVCAFAGRERVLAAYEHAVEAGYRFTVMEIVFWFVRSFGLFDLKMALPDDEGEAVRRGGRPLSSIGVTKSPSSFAEDENTRLAGKATSLTCPFSPD